MEKSHQHLLENKTDFTQEMEVGADILRLLELILKRLTEGWRNKWHGLMWSRKELEEGSKSQLIKSKGKDDAAVDSDRRWRELGWQKSILGKTCKSTAGGNEVSKQKSNLGGWLSEKA